MSTKERLDLFYEKLNENNLRPLIAKIVAWLNMTVYSYFTRMKIIIFGLLWGIMAISGRIMAHTTIRENNVQKNVWNKVKYIGIEKKEWARYLRNIVIRFELKAAVFVIFFATMGIMIGGIHGIPFDVARAVLAYLESITVVIIIPYLLYELGIKIMK